MKPDSFLEDKIGRQTTVEQGASRPDAIIVWMGQESDEVICYLKEKKVEFVAIPVSDLYETEVIYGLRRVSGFDEARRLIDDIAPNF